jgi:hypothetical protein
MSEENKWINRNTIEKSYYFTTGSNSPFYSAQVQFDSKGDIERINYNSIGAITGFVSLHIDDLNRINELVCKIRKDKL